MAATADHVALPTRVAAKKLCCHPHTLRRWGALGHIRFVTTPGGHRRWLVDEFLADRR